MGVGKNIRQLREAKQMTQFCLAKKVGITPAMLCQIERGTRNPSLQVGKEIADILGCKIDELLADT